MKTKARIARRAPAGSHPVPPHPPLTRPELLALAALLLLALALRFAYPHRMAIEHFDEGVYASNIFFGAEEGHRYPFRHLYAPPLLPWLIEWGIVFLGPDSIAPFLPALILGTATVPLAWWSVRCWFGRASGLAAGLLVATSDFHVLYSRAALTDVPVAFFILLAVYLYWESVRRASVAWAFAAGLATALAWWTKYTGWLPLAIAASASAAWLLFDRFKSGASLNAGPAAGASPRVAVWTVAKLLAVMAITAFAAWSPVLYDLQPYGGYASVAANHRGYLVGFAGWPRAASQQIQSLRDVSGVPTALGLWIVVTGTLLRRRPDGPTAAAILSGLAIATSALAFGPAMPFALLAAISLLIASMSRATPPGHRLAVWLVAAWVAGMTLTTPLYSPYSRLALPWLSAAWLGTAVLPLAAKRPASLTAPPRAIAAIAFAAALLLALPLWSARDRFTAAALFPAWPDRTAPREIATRFLARVSADRPADAENTVIFVLDEPAWFYQFRARQDEDTLALLAGEDLAFATESAPPGSVLYLVTGPHAWETVAFKERWRQVQTRFRLIDEIDFPATGITALDRFRPAQPRETTFPARLHRYVPPAP